MTFVSLILSVFISAPLAQADVLIISAIQYKAAESPVIAIGFSDSSFDYDAKNPRPESKTFCYLGNAAEVCSQIQREARKMQSLYNSGAHDTMELHSCAIEKLPSDDNIQIVHALYTLSDDYSVKKIPVDRSIARCQ